MSVDTISISHSPSLTLALEPPVAASVPTTWPSMTSTGANTGTLPNEVLCLQGEIIRAMGQLLTTRCLWMLTARGRFLDTEATFHQNKAQTTEAIREATAHCTAMIQEAEATCSAAIREAETACAD